MPADDTAAAEGPAPRLSDRPFPAYAHIPGTTPHPIRDPAGHSYKVRLSEVVTADPADWRSCDLYREGVDLFNAGYYWEAHEAWEAVWVAAGRRGAGADFLKALIKLAAGGVKIREGTPAGARRHLRRALELFETVTQRSHTPDQLWFGLSPKSLSQSCERLLAGPLPDPPPRGGQPHPVLEITLLPR
jgi:hypothetical protein